MTALIAGLLAAALVLTLEAESGEAPLAEPGRTTILVVDVSSSIQPRVFRQVGDALDRAMREGGRFGVVLFSDIAYELLPTGSPASALGPVTAYLTPLPGELNDRTGGPLYAPDPWSGGFRGGTKFPTPVRWEFLLHAARKWGDAPMGAAVKATLDAMASGGIRDPIGGGFHRYSTDERWETPHFEKMLYDNAQLAALYLEAGVAFKDPRYTAVATDTPSVSVARLSSPAGWSEPGQTPEFDEVTVVLRGALHVETRQGTLRVVAGQAVITHKGEWVRYSTPEEGGAEYIAVCVPAFSLPLAHRES